VNSDTLVVVQAYDGELKQVQELLTGWTHHGCQVVIISPEDAPVEVPGIECRWAGKRGWGGLHTIDRQVEHLEIIAEYPQECVLYNDADSFCLPRKIPSYLYEGEDVFWSNERPTGIFFDSAMQLAFMNVDLTNISAEHVGNMQQIEDAKNAAAYLLNIPDWQSYRFKQTEAYQPPYFFHADVVGRMLANVDESKKDIVVPLIDWWWPLVVKAAGLRHETHPNGHSHTTDTIRELRGHDMVHSITERAILNQLLEESS
jgi:hypothetical protein